MDVAMLLATREQDPFEDAAVCLWWDSTPHGGYDWLLSQVHFAHEEHLGDFLRLLHALLHEAAGKTAVGERTVELAGQVNRCVELYTFIPVTLGLRQSSLPHKVSAFLHALLMTSGSLKRCRKFCESVVSVTSDFGVEAGLTDFHSTDLSSLLPGWLVPQEVEPDEGGLDDVSSLPCEGQQGEPGEQWESSFLLRYAMHVPGLLHIVSNLLAEAHAQLSHWARFHERCLVIEKLLVHKPRRDRLIQTCVLDTPFATQRCVIDKGFPRLYDKRWHHILQFCRALLSVWPLLRSCWRGDRYLKGHSAIDGGDGVANDDFSVQRVTAVVRDPVFGAYLRMVLAADSIAEHVGSWGEGCACHEAALCDEPTEHRRQNKVRRLTRPEPKQPGGACRMAGKRSWELATGKVADVLQQSACTALSDLMVDVRWTLSDEQRAIVAADFDAARAHIDAQLQQKLHFWGKLPWCLCGMAAPDPAVARRAAADALRMYEASKHLPDHAHHRLTVKMLKAGTQLRKEYIYIYDMI